MNNVAQKSQSVTLENSVSNSDVWSVCSNCGQTITQTDTTHTEKLSSGKAACVCNDCVSLEIFNDAWENAGRVFFVALLKQVPAHLRYHVMDNLAWSASQIEIDHRGVKFSPEQKTEMRRLTAGNDRTVSARVRLEALRFLKAAVLELETGEL